MCVYVYNDIYIYLQMCIMLIQTTQTDTDLKATHMPTRHTHAPNLQPMHRRWRSYHLEEEEREETEPGHCQEQPQARTSSGAGNLQQAARPALPRLTALVVEAVRWLGLVPQAARALPAQEGVEAPYAKSQLGARTVVGHDQP